MLIIGCDYHPSWQQICWVNTETGETQERKLERGCGEAERFYRGLVTEGEGSCQSCSGEEIGDSTLLDAEDEYGLSRGRSCREQLAGARGRPAGGIG